MSYYFLSYFQIAYRTASNRFPNKLSELFLVLSDDYPAQLAQEGLSEAEGFQPRGQKHRLDDDQMSVQSTGTKRPDNETSAEKNKKKQQPKSTKSKPKH